MKDYTFKVVVEPDADCWHAYCPSLGKYGASTWGNTKEEALARIMQEIRIRVDWGSEKMP